MKSNERLSTLPDEQLGDLIKRIPYSVPDPALTRRIMAWLVPRPKGWLQRFTAKALNPVTVSLSPLSAVAAVLVICLAGALIYRQISLKQPVVLATDSRGDVPVVFYFRDASAASVAVLGTFNNWDPKGYQMTRDPKTGEWTIEVHLTPGKHEYVFLLDNKKITPDPHADLNYRDEFGNRNSVVFVKGNHGQSI